MKVSELQDIKQRYKIVGNCASLNHALDVALQVAPTDLSVLIVGESGVGKEVIPRVIHDSSPRRRGKYFAINCGSIPEGTIDSELFGHVKGSFTGAIGDSPGYFGAADKGTLFLDEVGELPLQTQVRLLRVLETGEFIRMGSSQVQKTNVRVVAATNLNMQKAIEAGRFREDLYYRLNTVEIRVPALRDRKEDIPLLFRKFSVDFCNRYQMPPLMLNDEATRLLQSYYWNGNIRQLKNIAEQVSVIEMDHHISAETLQRYLPDNERNSSIVLSSAPSETPAGKDYAHEISLLYNMVMKLQQEISELKTQLADARRTAPAPSLPRHTHTPLSQAEEIQDFIEIADDQPAAPQPPTLETTQRETILRVLNECNGNRKVAAERLGISERTLYRKIKEYNI